jgi:hypothetical protein
MKPGRRSALDLHSLSQSAGQEQPRFSQVLRCRRTGRPQTSCNSCEPRTKTATVHNDSFNESSASPLD